MSKDGKIYPIIPFNLIIDTDVGVLQLINDKYHDINTFYHSLLIADIQYQITLLYQRKDINPLTVIAINKEDIDTLDKYYSEFMIKEYEYILNHSYATNLYYFLLKLNNRGEIYPTIWCKNDIEKDTLINLDSRINKCYIVVCDTIEELIDDSIDVVFIKNIMDSISIIPYIEGKNLYIPNARYNYEDNDKTKLLKEPDILLSGKVQINSFQLYGNDTLISMHY